MNTELITINTNLLPSIPTNLIDTYEALDARPTYVEERKICLSKYGLRVGQLIALLALGCFAFSRFYQASEKPEWKDKVKARLSNPTIVAACAMPALVLLIGLICIRRFFPSVRAADSIDSHKVVLQKEKCLPIILAIIEKLKTFKYFKRWCEQKKMPPNQLCEDLWTELQGGQCWGHAVAMLDLMPNYFSYESKDLLKLVKVERIIYLQILAKIVSEVSQQECRKRNIFRIDLTNDPVLIFIYHLINDPIFKREALPLRDFCSFEIPSEKIDSLFSHKSITSEAVDLTNDLGQIIQAFASAKSKLAFPPQTFFAGKVKLVKTREHIGHAIFFQCGGGYYRFYESARSSGGFYEFNGEEALFIGLVEHVKTIWQQYAQGKIAFTIHAIPTQRDTQLSKAIIV